MSSFEEMLQNLARICAEVGCPYDDLAPLAQPALRLVTGEAPGALGSSRLGGMPDLPPDLEWPRWDVRKDSLAKVLSGDIGGDRGKLGSLPQYMSRLGGVPGAESLPLAFLAQINLADVPALSSLPLPSAGHLFFFYEALTQTWGFDPLDRGSFRVLYVPAGASLAGREAPDNLSSDVVFGSGREVSFETSLSLREPASWWEDDSIDDEAFFDVLDALTPGGEAGEEHQMGGHPAQIQNDMPPLCSLVTKGVYMGGPPGLPEAKLKELTADEDEWRLLLQVGSDEGLGWMWGDAGCVYFWIKESDLRHLRFDRCWIQLQCS